jgi:hypothetical protein
MSVRLYQHLTEEQLAVSEQRFRAAIDGNIRGLELLAEERAIRKARSSKIEDEPAAPHCGAAGPQ